MPYSIVLDWLENSLVVLWKHLPVFLSSSTAFESAMSHSAHAMAGFTSRLQQTDSGKLLDQCARDLLPVLDEVDALHVVCMQSHIFVRS